MNQQSSAELPRQIESMVDATEPLPPEPAATRYVPYPVDGLPEPLRGFVLAGAKATGCDSAYIALPLLAVCAAAIGNTRRLMLKRGWFAVAILWVVLVGESGTLKTPAFQLALRALRKRQELSLKRYTKAMQQYELDLARWEKDFASWKRDKNNRGDPPKKPKAPVAERHIVSDTTVEALVPLLQENWRGILLARDELAGWIGSFDRYAAKGAADEANWLSMHSGESIVNDRKSPKRQTTYVEKAAVCVCGGIQPGILDRALGREHRESGLAARLLLAWPPRKRKRWTDADIDPDAEVSIAQLIDRLYELAPDHDANGEPLPATVRLSPEARQLWIAYYNTHADEQAELTGDLSAAWSKLEEYAARFALVIHFIRWAASDPTLTDAGVVDAESMGAAIQLATWHKAEAVRVYRMLGESDEEGDDRRLVEWLNRHDGLVTPRDVQQNCSWLKAPGAAEAALERLAKTGAVKRELTPAGQRGRPTVRYRVTSDYDTAKKPEENCNTVDVDSVDAVETDSDDAGAATEQVPKDPEKGPVADFSRGQSTITNASTIEGNKSQAAAENSAAIDALRAGGLPA